MEKMDKRDEMIQQLTEGIDAAKQLHKRILSTKHHKDHHNDQTLINHLLLDKMLSSLDNTISIAKSIHINNNVTSPTHSNLPLISNPTTQNSQLHLSKKRKLMPTWSKEVDVGVEEMMCGLQGPLDDGLCWRKYGQKDILNAKFPREYYRCTHRHTQGCQATKHVQRSDEHTSIYRVIYRGQHTCIPMAQQSKAQSKPNKAQTKPQESPHEQEVNLVLSPNENESLAHIFRSFSFKTAQIDSGPSDNFLLGCSSTFWSPATVTGDIMTVQTSESDWNGSISGPSSVSNSPMRCDFEFEFSLDHLLDIDEVFSNFEF